MTSQGATGDVEETLRGHGIDVESLDGNDPLELTYTTAFPGQRIHEKEAGRACNAFIELVERDAWEPTGVEATVLRAPGDVLGTWAADGAWFAAVADGELSETEFSARVLDTMIHDGDAAQPPESADGSDA